MTRRLLFRSLAAAPGLHSPVREPEPPYAVAPLTRCAKCDGDIFTLSRQSAHPTKRLVRCSDEFCENGWPWIQDGQKAVRVSALQRAQILRLEAQCQAFYMGSTGGSISQDWSQREFVQAQIDGIVAG